MNSAAILSADQVANLMRCKTSTIEEKARRGEIPGVLWGDGGWVFPADALYERLNELAIEGAKTRRAPAPVPIGVSKTKQSRARREPPPLPSLGGAS